jgi:FkbM family methyltransferase
MSAGETQIVGNSSQRGNDDRPFQHYTLKHTVVSWISRNLFDHVSYTVRHGLLKGMKRKGGLAWIPGFGNSLETPEHRFLAALDVSGKVVFDVGGFEGLITLFIARKAARVICYEPNSRNHARLCENLSLNRVQNVTVRRYGLGAVKTTSVMTTDPRMAGGATLLPSISRTIEHRGVGKREEISVTTLDEDIDEAHLPDPDFIKVDVEGYELQVLQGARGLLERKRPALYLEMHGETMNEKRMNVRAIVEFLNSIGYDDILHIESSQQISFTNSEVAAQGHLYAVGSKLN